VWRNPEWRVVPIVVVTARDLTAEDRKRLNGHVQTVLQKQGDSRDSMLAKVRDILSVSTAARVRSAAEPA
jgi:hypothetical protein